MKAPTSKEARAARDADFEQRMQPRMVWPREEGTALRVVNAQGEGSYRHKPIVKKGSKARKLTEAENNALGRAARRRINRRIRCAGKPHSAR